MLVKRLGGGWTRPRREARSRRPAGPTENLFKVAPGRGRSLSPPPAGDPLKYPRTRHGRLAEVLHERGLAERTPSRLCSHKDDGTPFCEALVTSNIVSDWELSKVVCETFRSRSSGRPGDAQSRGARGGRRGPLPEHQLVPIDLFGQILTVAMPGSSRRRCSPGLGGDRLHPSRWSGPWSPTAAGSSSCRPGASPGERRRLGVHVRRR